LTSKSTPSTQSKTTAKNRLTPIKETMQTVRGYPSSLVIYKTAASRFYWVRCFFNGKYKVKTTKSEYIKSAKEFAAQFYKDTLLSSVTTKTSERNKQFAVVGNLFFQSTKKNSTASTYKADYNRYTQHILKEFNQQEVDTITNAQISQFVEKLHATGIKHATIKHHIIVLRKILKFAIANDLMTNLPVFPRITGKLQTSLKRDYLTVPEYDLVCKCADELAQKKTTVQGITITDEMKYLIQFMVNSFIRPSDLRVLKHKHINHKKDGKTEWLELTHPATKTNANAVQAMPVSVHIYRNLMDYRKKAKLKTTPNDFVFFPEFNEKQRNKVMQIVAKLFKRIVAETGIEEKTDKKLTLYSLRHTAIMMRLTIGQVDTLSLARNARTSQAMIDKFYAAHLTTDQVRKQLHAFPNTKTPKSISSIKTTETKSKNLRKTKKSAEK
jgi:site-specific recombinase XerD